MRVRSKTIAQRIDGQPCQSNNPLQTTILADITGAAAAGASYTIVVDGKTGTLGVDRQGDTWYFTLGPVDYASTHYQGGEIRVVITAYNSQQVPTQTTVSIALDVCKLG